MGVNLRSLMDALHTDIPEGVSGDWRVERFEVTEAEISLARLRAQCNPNAMGRGSMDPGTHTRLMRGGTLVMSDTPDEIRDIWGPIMQAGRRGGHCLVNGMGLGLVVTGLLLEEAVERVTVIELSPDVITLVAPYMRDRFGDRLEIIEADAFAWRAPRGSRWTVAWHDVWDTICADNLEEMAKLHRKYGRRADWQGSWCKAECLRARERWG